MGWCLPRPLLRPWLLLGAYGAGGQLAGVLPGLYRGVLTGAFLKLKGFCLWLFMLYIAVQATESPSVLLFHLIVLCLHGKVLVVGG